MRKLVTIQKIVALNPIPNKDRIVLAQILGWQVIVKKDEFKVGDTCVFFEIDSFLPTEERYSFLGSTTKYKNKNGYRLKTMKMSGVLSQGLALPLHMFPELQEVTIDEDVSGTLNVIKYDIDVVQRNSGNVVIGQAQGKFPSFIPKTDQTRIQSLPQFFEMYKDIEFEETLKLDGSSCTMYSIIKQKTDLWSRIKQYFGYNTTDKHFGVCSRNLEIKPSTRSNFWQVALEYQVEKHLPEGYAIQGELIGPNIQSNHESVEDLDFYIFDIYNIKEQRYLSTFGRQQFIKDYLPHMKHTPIINSDIKILQLSLEDILKRVETESINPGTISEGRVYKATNNPSITFKVINNQYLLKTGK